jgi:hypothetical protein
MADIASTWRLWSTTASANQPTSATTIGSGLPDNLQTLQAVPRKYLASYGSAIASAATMDLSTMDGYAASVTGNTTVTSLGAEAVGISYLLTFASTPMFKNGANLLLGGSDITFAAGDVATFISEGGGVSRLTGFRSGSGMTGTGAIVRASAPSIASPALTGTPTAPTAAAGTSTTQIATTAFVFSATVSVERVYTSTTGWAKPAGLKYIQVECWGAGGGGGSANSSGGTTSQGGDGGTGGYTRKTIAATSLADSVTATVGAAGTSDTNGGLSAFQAHCTASGGLAGAAGGADTVGAGGAGGGAVNGDLNISGFTGGMVSIFAVGNRRAATEGYSVGGGGASDSSGSLQPGGTGRPGLVIVREFYI